MTVRGARILIGGACTHHGGALVEAFLALGAHVVAADRLRTRLEELRARLRQHERLWVAEADLAEPSSAAALFADVAREEPVDAALLVVPAGELANVLPQPAGEPAGIDAFLRAAIAAMRPHGRGRALVLLEAPAATAQAAISAATAEALLRGAEAARLTAPGVAMAGLFAAGPAGVLLERVVAACDPARPALSGWQSEG